MAVEWHQNGKGGDRMLYWLDVLSRVRDLTCSRRAIRKPPADTASARPVGRRPPDPGGERGMSNGHYTVHSMTGLV